MALVRVGVRVRVRVRVRVGVRVRVRVRVRAVRVRVRVGHREHARSHVCQVEVLVRELLAVDRPASRTWLGLGLGLR